MSEEIIRVDNKNIKDSLFLNFGVDKYFTMGILNVIKSIHRSNKYFQLTFNFSSPLLKLCVSQQNRFY